MFSKFIYIFLIVIIHQGVRANPEFPGGKSSVFINGVQAFSLPMKGLKNTDLIKFMVGNSIFRSNWISSPASVENLQGLGPLFNTRSCAACHANDGRSIVTNENGILGTGLLFRISILKNEKYIAHPVYGDQIQPQGIIGVKGEATPMVKYIDVLGKYLSGEEYKLRKPIYWIKDYLYGDITEKVYISPRIAPQMIGLGLIELIPESSIIKNADPDDLDADGISGRANYSIHKKKKLIGRFGWKANQSNLLSQNTGALLGDLGITSSEHPKQNCNLAETDCVKAHALSRVEINSRDLDRLNFYTQTIAVPVRRNITDPLVRNGEKNFISIGCIKCHVSEFTTGKTSIPQLSNQKIYPYSDFLLHDMGSELSDDRPDLEASGVEWKTPPLWGIGLIKTVNRNENFLHDGRAKTIEEAILWHGGEGTKSKEEFLKLSKKERIEVLKFVESL